MAPPMSPEVFFNHDVAGLSPPPTFNTSGVHFRMAFELGSNNTAAPVTLKNRPRRNVRKLQARRRPRAPLFSSKPATQVVPAAADTDSKLEDLSPEVQAMQEEARATVMEDYGKVVDRDSLETLEYANKINLEFTERLNLASLAVIEAATAPIEDPEPDETDVDGDTAPLCNKKPNCDCLECGTTRSEDEPIYFTLGRAGRSANGSESYYIVDSTPSLNSDDVFGAGIPRTLPKPSMELVMPVLSFGNPSSDNTASSGRPLAPIDDDSTASSGNPSPPINTPTESVSSMSTSMVQPATLAARLEAVKIQVRIKGKVKEWKGEGSSQSWLAEQIAAAMAEDVEALDDDDHVLDDGEEGGDEDWVVVNEEDADDDWFEVASETIVKSEA